MYSDQEFLYYFGCIELRDNVFIGAGAVVTKDVAPGTIVGGVPARVIGSLDDTIKKCKEYSEKYSGKSKNNELLRRELEEYHRF